MKPKPRSLLFTFGKEWCGHVTPGPRFRFYRSHFLLSYTQRMLRIAFLPSGQGHAELAGTYRLMPYPRGAFEVMPMTAQDLAMIGSGYFKIQHRPTQNAGFLCQEVWQSVTGFRANIGDRFSFTKVPKAKKK